MLRDFKFYKTANNNKSRERGYLRAVLVVKGGKRGASVVAVMMVVMVVMALGEV